MNMNMNVNSLKAFESAHPTLGPTLVMQLPKEFKLTLEEVIDTSPIWAKMWTTRPAEVKRQKRDNFVLGWLAEIAFNVMLSRAGIKFNAPDGIWIGPPEQAAKKDFIIFDHKEPITIGIRSRRIEKLNQYREIPYPYNRIKDEPEVICDYIVAAGVDQAPCGSIFVFFCGCISKEDLLLFSTKSIYHLSIRNMEVFKTVGIAHFSLDLLENLLDTADHISNEPVVWNISGDGSI